MPTFADAIQEASNLSKNTAHSPSYPSSELNSILEFVTKIHTDLGHTQYHDKELIAKALGFAWSSIKMKISTCVQYGLLELKHGVGYKVSPLFIQIHKPVTEEEKRSALIEALRNPDLYSRLIDEYNEDVIPNIAVLGTILFRKYNIMEKAAEKAAEIFINNLKSLGLLNQENRLFLTRTGQSQNSEEIIIIDSADKNSGMPPLLPPQFNTQIISTEMIDIPIPLKSGKKAFLKIPEDITPEDIERVAKFVDALK